MHQLSPSTMARGLRTVAVFEAAKGTLVLLVGLGLLSMVHRDIQALAVDIVRHFHLNPASRYPHIFLEAAAKANDLSLWLLAAGAFGYTLVRLIEAYGLWLGRRWAQWFGALSGAIYLPIEIYELTAGITPAKIIVLLVNLIVVVYLAFSLGLARQ
ncbi:MAG: DUF2127 domain-containing protein [Gammaproteobacteria bacterium]